MARRSLLGRLPGLKRMSFLPWAASVSRVGGVPRMDSGIPMNDLQASWTIWLVALIQLAGLGSVWFARASEGLTHQKLSQWLFVACLALVGGTTMLVVSLGPGVWLTSGGILSVMVVAAIFDSGDARDAVIW
jgi:hypothetical protein